LIGGDMREGFFPGVEEHDLICGIVVVESDDESAG